MMFQIHYEVDDLNRQLQAKKGDYGYNLQNAKMISEAFKQFEMTIQVRSWDGRGRVAWWLRCTTSIVTLSKSLYFDCLVL
jgi:hypothetical protein